MDGDTKINPVEAPHSDEIVQQTANIVSAYVRNNVVPANDLQTLIGDVHTALAGLHLSSGPDVPFVAKPKPAVSIKKSVEDDCITCLEDGLRFKSLKRHLMTFHNMTPEQYRARWALPDEYPMVAPSYADRRSQLAKNMGLGHKRKKNRE